MKFISTSESGVAGESVTTKSVVVGASPRSGNDARSKSTSAEYFTRRMEGTHTMYAGPLRSVPR